MIDALLADAIRSGRIVGLTLFRTSEGRWQASTTADRVSWRVEFDADPAAAILRVLDAPAQSAVGPEDIFG